MTHFLQALPRQTPQPAIVLYPQVSVKPQFQRNFGRIYGGDLANEGQFPFAVHIQTRRGNQLYVCTSSILDANTLATAAHCLEDVTLITATAGSLNWREPGDNAQVLLSEPGNFNYHEDFLFDSTIIRNDVGYIKLDGSFEFNEFVQPIPVAGAEPAPGDLITAIGWGATQSLGSAADLLSYVENLAVVTDETADIFSNTFVYEQFICTFQASGGVCGGDSGGPTVNANGELIGATSFTAQRCETGPSCVTSLVFFSDWLRENANVDI